ncbi:MAG: hypothetical protein L3J79_07600 [Candidatus Marinimicrobia bacterium]|nr:hypothetical protein [Candidatus Neomarinimicrobiota bacterium]
MPRWRSVVETELRLQDGKALLLNRLRAHQSDHWLLRQQVTAHYNGMRKTLLESGSDTVGNLRGHLIEREPQAKPPVLSE